MRDNFSSTIEAAAFLAREDDDWDRPTRAEAERDEREDEEFPIRNFEPQPDEDEPLPSDPWG